MCEDINNMNTYILFLHVRLAFLLFRNNLLHIHGRCPAQPQSYPYGSTGGVGTQEHYSEFTFPTHLGTELSGHKKQCDSSASSPHHLIKLRIP